MTDTKVDIGKQKLLISPFKNVHELVKNLDYIIIIPLTVSFLMRTCGNTSPAGLFFCKKVLTNCYFYGKIGGATMVDARCFSILSSFFIFFVQNFKFCSFLPIPERFFVYIRQISARPWSLCAEFRKSQAKN